MAFQYQLQKVLSLMLDDEKRVDGLVMAANAQRNAEQAKLDEIALRKTAAQKGLNAQMAAGATPDVAASNDYIQVLNLRIEAQAKVVKAVEKHLDELKVKQVAARQKRQKIETHREMKFAEFKLQEKKREAQRTDEMAGTIYMKQRALRDEASAEELERFHKLEQLRLLRELQAKRDKRR